MSYVHKSTVGSEILEAENQLQTANDTHWNSQLKMIRSVLKCPESKLNQLETVHLSAYERNILKEMVVILEPFEEATDYAQTENYASAGYVVPSIRGLRAHLDEMKVSYNCGFVTALCRSVDIRLSQYEQSKSYLIAAVIDPRFKLAWCRYEMEQQQVSR